MFNVPANRRAGVPVMGIGMRELLVILVVALLVFGTKKLKTIGSDLGGAVRGFKKAMEDGENETTVAKSDPPTSPKIADASTASTASEAKKETIA
jgi:sec-independent protein translocase protein TatA